ncbi:MAG: chorismate mutase [Methanosaeta sp. PtaB.Bin039]|nr:MAG: chorismate mutase [Methanosaeta sp. PtaB.Bin039]HOT07748.1 chorismate mutase [Methanotrichaceae archaeon]HQF16969.1 chorismate mutase [Methanotrichaceae archaeon]HQI91589.1 chorismate mutase [Methanotrichaceae archaeon]HQJ28916.1 chorismate mutase [Methanotrichaceae archaeon]
MDLAESRIEVAKIDKEIIRLIGRRLDLAREIYLAKVNIRAPIEDPVQEKVVVDRAIDLATEEGIDAGDVKEIFRILIRMNLAKQHAMRGDEDSS